MAIEIRAHITGTVWKIQKKVGEHIQTGEVLLIMESMKMEMPLESPETGTVQQLHCNEGDSVEEGQLLALVG